jgi:GAF domain-containing protein
MFKEHINRFDLSATLNRIVTESLRLLNADRSALFLYDSQTDTLTIEASIGLSGRYLRAVSDRWKDFPVGRLIQDRGLLSAADVQADRRFLPAKEEIQAEGFRSIIVVPLVFEDASFGTLGLYFDEVRELSAEEKGTVQTFGDLAAVAIENARALEEIRFRSERREALRKVMRDITEDLDLSALFSRICRSVSELLRLTYVHVFIFDEKSESFILAGSFGKTVGGEGDYAVLPAGRGILSRVLNQREPVVVRDLLKDPDWVGHEWAERAGVRTFLGIPLLRQDRMVGELSCFSTELRDFRPDEIELLQDFADQAVVALENANAF